MSWFSLSEDNWAIGAFQLENIVQNISHFYLFDLRKALSTMGEEEKEVNLLAPYLEKSIPIPVDQLRKWLEEQQVSKDTPIVLICQNGRTSIRAAKALNKQGFINVYYLKGGTKALLEFIFG